MAIKRRLYESPPISEAVREFRFDPSQPWDSTVLGLVYDRVKRDYPKKKQQIGLSLEIHGSPQEVQQQIGNPTPRMQFLSEDEKSLIQLSTDALSINKLKPYQSWEVFKKTILSTLTAYVDVNQPKGIRRIGIRYINRIEIPAAVVKIEDYLLATPSLPAPLPQEFQTWVQRVEVPVKEQDGLLVIQSGSIRDGKSENIAFLLDIDFIVQKTDQAIPLESASNVIEAAHEQVENAFEACITDNARTLFKEKSQNG